MFTQKSRYGLILPNDIEDYFNNLEFDELLEHAAALSQMALEERQHQLKQEQKRKNTEGLRVRLFGSRYDHQ